MKKLILYICIFLFSTLVVIGQNTNENKSTAAANVSVLEKEFVIPNLNNISHKIWLYLPPNYHQTKKKFPVIYMHDAQNLFDKNTSYVGEWEVDETLNKLYNESKKGFIVVGIEHGGEERINELTPWENKKYGGGKGVAYMKFLVNTLKPFIDSNYRTKKNRKNTTLIGSSLGGLISYYGGLKYSKTFGKIGAISTSFWFSEIVIDFTVKHGKLNNTRLLLLVGGKEGSGMEEDTQKIEKLLLVTGFNSKNLKTKINPTGEHNEAFWKSEYATVIKWLFKIK